MRTIAFISILLSSVTFMLIGCTTSNSTLQDQLSADNQNGTAPAFADIPLNANLFLNANSYSPPTTDQLLLLTPQQQEEFLSFFYSESQQHKATDRRLSSFVERRYSDFNYFGKTLKAAETLQGETGNCMSLAILTTAYAKLVDVTISYQMVYSAPIYELVDDIMYISSHVRSRVASPLRIDQKSGIMHFSSSYIDYFPTPSRSRGLTISEPLFISMYYQNVAAELLKQDADKKAFYYLKKALEIAPDNVAAINSLAVVHRRQKDYASAEQLYRFILQNHQANLNVIVNFREMLRLLGRHDEAETLNTTIAQIDDPNPYEWITLADEAISNNELTRAARYLQRAEQLAPYLDEVYFQYARLDYIKGHPISAKRHLVLAQQYARSLERRHLYQAKLGIPNEDH